MVPANTYMTIVNKTQTVLIKVRKVLLLNGSMARIQLLFRGRYRQVQKKHVHGSSIWEPANYTVSVFKKAVEEQGIMFSAAPKVGAEKVTKGATLVTSKQSMPLKELFIPFMKLSNNGHAEVLVKEMGRAIGGEGSWEKGLAVMQSTLADMGLDTKICCFEMDPVCRIKTSSRRMK